MDKQNGGLEIDVFQMLRAMWHKIWLIILLAVVGAAAAFCYATYLVVPTYQSSALMYVNTGSFNVGEMIKMNASDLSFSSSLVKYYIVILNTRSTLEEVIEEAELPYSYGQLSSMISASAVNDTCIFRVTVTSTDPYEAEKIANTITYVLPEKIEDIMDGTSARVVDYAVLPTQKSAPNITRMTSVGMAAGAALAAAIIVIIELLDDIIHGGSYLSDSFEIPVLAEIPELYGNGSGGKHGKYGKYSKYDKYSKYSKYDKYGKYSRYGSNNVDVG